MQIADAEDEFLDYLRAKKLSLSTLTAETALKSFAQFYVQQRAENTTFEDDGDMLNCQWDAADDDEDRFELHHTRQLTVGEGASEEVWQLRLTLTFDLAGGSDSFEAGATDWCSHPDDIGELLEAIEEEDFLCSDEHSEPAEVHLTLESIG